MWLRVCSFPLLETSIGNLPLCLGAFPSLDVLVQELVVHMDHLALFALCLFLTLYSHYFIFFFKTSQNIGRERILFYL